MIVRLMGEGQFEIDDEVAKGLHELDEQAGQAVEQGDEERLAELLRRLGRQVGNQALVGEELLRFVEAEILGRDDRLRGREVAVFEPIALFPDEARHLGEQAFECFLVA